MPVLETVAAISAIVGLVLGLIDTSVNLKLEDNAKSKAQDAAKVGNLYEKVSNIAGNRMDSIDQYLSQIGLNVDNLKAISQGTARGSSAFNIINSKQAEYFSAQKASLTEKQRLRKLQSDITATMTKRKEEIANSKLWTNVTGQDAYHLRSAVGELEQIADESVFSSNPSSESVVGEMSYKDKGDPTKVEQPKELAVVTGFNDKPEKEE